MSNPPAYRTPFVLGKPIKNPADFYGRKELLAQLFDLIKSAQIVSVVGEHRCGNTSVIYQLMHPDVRGQHLSAEEDQSLVFAFVSAQLASSSPEAFYRRVQRALKRADPDAEMDFRAAPEPLWLEEYLEDLSDRQRRLVLLVDELEVLADFDEAFWEWFEGLVTHFDVSLVATTRQDLGEFRARTGRGPAFFNMVRSVHVGSFSPEAFETFIADKTELTDFDFDAVRDELTDLAGRYPFYLQSAAAVLYLRGGAAQAVDDELLATVRREFRDRVWALFDDAWHKLPAVEQEALTWLLLDSKPGGDDTLTFQRALQSLERRGYVVDGRIFSTVFQDYVREQCRHVALSPSTGQARVGRKLVDLPTDQLALLRLFLNAGGQVVTHDAIARAVWPDHLEDGRAVSPERIASTIQGLHEAIEGGSGEHAHIEKHGTDGWSLFNPDFPRETSET